MRNYYIYRRDPNWVLVTHDGKELTYTYFDDLLNYLANEESEERS